MFMSDIPIALQSIEILNTVPFKDSSLDSKASNSQDMLPRQN